MAWRSNATVLAVAAALGLALLAGCTGHGGSGPSAAPAAGTKERPALSGFVVDAALHPMPGANLTIAALNATTRSDGNGHYAFTALPSDQVMVVTATLESFRVQSRAVSIPKGSAVVLNFTLEAVPVLKPSMDVQKGPGFLSCQVTTTVDQSDRSVDCGGPGLGVSQDSWSFNVGPNLRGVVIETVWNATTPGSQFLNVTVTTEGLGDQQAVLSQVQGVSILRAEVNQSQAKKYYDQGGSIRVVVAVATDAADQELPSSAALALQQSYVTYATSFYVEAPPSGYSIANNP